MKKLFSLLLATLAILALAAAPATAAKKDKAAAKPAKKTKAEKKAANDATAKRGPIRVLLTTGGHAFEEKEFFAMWDGLKGIKYDKIELPKQADMLKPGLEKDYDVVVMYDMCKAFSPEQQKNFVDLVKSGKVGIVSTHHNLGAHADWPEFHKIIGGEYVMKARMIDGQEHAASTYDHDQDMKIALTDVKSPITRNQQPFEIHDEAYGKCYVSPQASVLLTTDHPKCTKEVAWVNTYEGVPVVYLMFGHDHKTWENPNYQGLLMRAIRFANRATHGGKPAKQQ